MKRFIVYSCLIIFIFNIFLFSQNPPCRSLSQRYSIRTDKIFKAPPLSTDMPYEIMKSYLFIDSICKNVGFDEFSLYLKDCSQYSSSFQNILRYYYLFWDYNQIKALTTSYIDDYNDLSKGQDSSIYIYDYIRLLDLKISEIYKGTYELLPLIKSGVIAEILIDSTVDRFVSDKNRWQLIAYCTILDTIKGKVLPALKMNVDVLSDPKFYKDPEPSQQKNKIGAKFQFAYWADDSRTCGDKYLPLRDSLGNNWIKTGKKYIVFLQPILNCRDSINIYYSLNPLQNGSCVFKMFPVNDGFVYNPSNEFGIPDGSTSIYFKEVLRGLIAKILKKEPIIFTDVVEPIYTNSDCYLKCINNYDCDKIRINYSISKNENAFLKLFDGLGRLILNKKLNNSNFDNYEDINTSNFSNGIYFIQLQSGSRILSEKFIVIK